MYNYVILKKLLFLIDWSKDTLFKNITLVALLLFVVATSVRTCFFSELQEELCFL